MSRSASFEVGLGDPLAKSGEPRPNLEPLKTQIAHRQYTSLAGALLVVLGRAARKLTRHADPLPFWYNAVLFVGLTIVIGRLVQILFGTSSHVLAYGITQPLLELVALLSASTVVIVTAKNQTSFFATVRESVIPAIASEDDLIDLQRWLDSTFSLKRQLITILIYGFLEDLIPHDSFYRHVAAQLDLSFVRDLVRDKYAAFGRPSIDPVVFFKLQLVMFFEGLRLERQLVQVAADRLSVRWYLGYELHEALPDDSSLTRKRDCYCTYDGIAEWQARIRTQRTDPEIIKLLKDKLLRIPLDIERHQNEE
jgi:transposase